MTSLALVLSDVESDLNELYAEDYELDAYIKVYQFIIEVIKSDIEFIVNE